MLGQCGAGIARAVDQVQHAGRQAGPLPQFDRLGGRLRRIFARLEHDGIACNQSRHDMTVRQMTGEVVGTEHAEYAMRPVPQYRVAVGDLALRLAGAAAVGLHRDVDLVGHGRDFGARFPQRLADFDRNQARQVFGIFLQQVAKAHADGDPLIQRGTGPAFETGARGSAGAIDLGCSGHVAAPDRVASGRIDGGQWRAIAFDPLTVDKVTVLARH